MELVDVSDSKSDGSNTVSVRVRPRAPFENNLRRLLIRKFLFYTSFYIPKTILYLKLKNLVIK